MKIHIFIFYTLIFILSYIHTSAAYFKPQGVIQEAEFIIKKEKKNELPESTKLYKTAQLMPDSPKPAVQHKWEFDKYTIQFQSIQHKIKLLRTQPDQPEEIHSNCLRIGYGNYYSPYIMAFLTNTIQHKYVYDIQVSHLSLGKKKHLETYHNQAALGLKIFTTHLLLDNTIHYNGDKYPFVVLEKGKPLQENDPKQHILYQHMGISTKLYNRIAHTFNYHITVTGQYLHQQKIKEPQGTILVHLNRKLTATLRANLDTTFQTMHYKHPITAYQKMRNIVRLQPTFGTVFQKLAILSGVKIAYQNDAKALAQHLYFYPVLSLTYALHSTFQPYVTLEGDIQPHSWATNIQQNPWLNHAADIRYSNNPWSGTLGMRSDILNIHLHIGARVSQYQNYPCFINNVSDPRTFNIAYDSSTSVINPFIEISKNSFGTTLKTLLQARYFHHILTDLQAPWHRPTYQVTLSNTYNFHDKLLVTKHILWEGGRQAQEKNTLATKTLASCFNLALSLEYFWNQRFIIFLDCKNILNSTNQQYLNTPTYGPHIMVGIAYRW